jgi:hypothetical protein
MYSYLIKATSANNSDTFSAKAFVKVIINCTIDVISIKKEMPNSSEPSYTSYVKFGRYAVLNINQSLGSM